MKQNTILSRLKTTLASLALIFILACSNDSDEQIPIVTPVTPLSFNYTSDHIYNLNVVYFIPNDNLEVNDYHRRLSEILLDAQAFFLKEMRRNGYGDKTFGLSKDEAKKRIRITVIKGKLGKDSYTYDGGASPVMQEISEYRSVNPSQFRGDHYLVIIPASTYSNVGEPGGVPFYGLGKYCFALDYADQDIKYLRTSSTLGNRATKWIGGLVHELGHGLNLPHNCQKVSEGNTLGMALMWAGNSTWAKSPTFLTAADCAVLNVNQIFNIDSKVYYGAVNSAIQRIQASYQKGSIVVSGKFTSDAQVTDVLYFNDPNVNDEGIGVNKDYNATAWVSKPIGKDSFYVEMPISDLKYTDNYPYELKVKFVHDNGTVVETIYSYSFVNGQPVLGFSTRPELNKQGWAIAGFSSEESTNANGKATNVIDTSPATYWHSYWSGVAAVYPHYLTLNIGSIKTVKGFSYTHRSGLVRAVKDLEFMYSTDGVNFASAGNFKIPKDNGALYFDFVSPLSFKYFQVMAKSSWDGEKFAAIAELGLY